MRTNRRKFVNNIMIAALGIVFAIYLFVPLAPNGTRVVITLEQKGGWYEPDYKIIVFGSGIVIYIGKDYVDVEGIRIARVDHKEIAKLVLEFKKAGFYFMQDKYVVDVTDLSGTMTTITINGQTKSVWRYGACNIPIPMLNNAPQELCDLESTIIKTVNSKQWTGK